MNKVEFSVVIPLYNKSYSIKRCVLSVLQQTVLPREIIIVNDGSTDDSLGEVEKFVEWHSGSPVKILLKNQSNQGVSAARNNGIKSSSSIYVALIDADDEWRPKFLEKMADLITAFPNQPLYTCRHQVSDPLVGLYRPPQRLEGEFGLIEDYHALAEKNAIANSSKVVINKEYFNNMGGFPVGEKVCEDLYVWSRLSNLGKVAYSSYYGSVIHQVPDTSRAVRDNSCPYIIRYYSDNRNEISASIRRYLWEVHKNHLLDSAMKNNRAEFWDRWRRASPIFRNRNYALLVFYLIPGSLLTRIKYLRRWFVKKVYS